MKTITIQGRQGDVFLRRVASVPAGAKPIARDGGACVLAHGELTGHAHRVLERGAEMFGGGGGTFLLIPAGGATLVHEEHSTLTIPAGTYEVTRQREYDDEEEWRQVAD